jgi:hypothetical protein
MGSKSLDGTRWVLSLGKYTVSPSLFVKCTESTMRLKIIAHSGQNSKEWEHIYSYNTFYLKQQTSIGRNKQQSTHLKEMWSKLERESSPLSVFLQGMNEMG